MHVCRERRERERERGIPGRENGVLRPCAGAFQVGKMVCRRPMEQWKNRKKASVAGAWRMRGGWRGSHWLDCKRGLVGLGKTLDFNPKSNGEATEGFQVGVEAGGECMAGFTFEKIALALEWRMDEGGWEAVLLPKSR